MLYDEFLAGTGCKDNKDNFQIYKDLEILYMNSELTKEKIYEYGKKLVNNALTDEQKEFNAGIDKEICDTKVLLTNTEADLARYNSNLNYYTAMGYADEESIKFWKKEIRLARKQIREYKELIKDLKNCKYVE